jgi:hypothetical protein
MSLVLKLLNLFHKWFPHCITKFGGEEIQEDCIDLVLQLKIKMKQQFRIFLRAHICKGQIEICLIYNFLHLQLGRVEIKLLTVIPREA